MDSYNIADAKAQFSELVGRAEAGEEIEIKRRGELVAKIVPAKRPRTRLDINEMKRIAEMGPPQEESAGDFIRRLRDADQL
jgi:prevent-host-death family protein